MSRFGERLQQARERAGLSRVALAAVAGVSYGTVWRWETGAVRIPAAYLAAVAPAIAGVTGVTVAWIVGKPDDDGVLSETHGTVHRYDIGCRCDPCRKAKAAKMRRLGRP